MDNSLRTNIDKIYGKENVELMLANFENFIDNSIEFKADDKRFLVYDKKMIKIWGNEIRYCEQRAKVIKKDIESVTKKIVV